MCFSHPVSVLILNVAGLAGGVIMVCFLIRSSVLYSSLCEQ
jgi:hypothetical protein